jgi:uncharacterized membrane protein YdjX (TVP38/TMEM64 family)
LAQPAEIPAPGVTLGESIAKAALLLAGVAAAGLALRWLGAGFLSAAPTLGGAGLFVAGAATLVAVGMPRQVVAFAAGYAFGAWRGGFLALAAQILGCATDFWWARLVARGWATRHLRGRLARIDRMLAANPFTTTLTLRLLPVGNNLLLNLLAGVSGLRAWPFLAASLIGYLPQTAIFALTGSGTHVDRGIQLALAGTLFLCSTALGIGLLRKGRPGAEPHRH